MKIKLTSIYVTDQDKALRFYTDVLGFTKKADFSQGPFRWLTVTSPEDPDGTELQLAADTDPAGKAFAKAKLDSKQLAIMLFSDDIQCRHRLGQRAMTSVLSIILRSRSLSPLSLFPARGSRKKPS